MKSMKLFFLGHEIWQFFGWKHILLILLPFKLLISWHVLKDFAWNFWRIDEAQAHQPPSQNPYRSSHGFNPSHETGCFLKDSSWQLCSLGWAGKNWKNPFEKVLEIQSSPKVQESWRWCYQYNALEHRRYLPSLPATKFERMKCPSCPSKEILKERYAVSFRRNNKEQVAVWACFIGFYTFKIKKHFANR